jgi:hypothetical protein
MNSAITFSTFSGFVAIFLVCGFLMAFIIRSVSGIGRPGTSTPRFSSTRRMRIAHRNTC